jgi:hypothetical protein
MPTNGRNYLPEWNEDEVKKVFGPNCAFPTVSIARPVKSRLVNPNYICNTSQDFLILISIV